MQRFAEWLEADGLGGFASGTVAGPRTRRYHAILLSAMTPPTGRVVLVNGFDAWIESPAGRSAISSQHYTPGVTHPDGSDRMESFEPDSWPTWRFKLDDGTRMEQILFVPHGRPLTVIIWRMLEQRGASRLEMRPFLSGRDYHSMHHQNPHFHFDAEISPERVTWRPYSGVPAITAWFNGRYVHDPQWYWNFEYDEERARGLDCTEDLASPGRFLWDFCGGDAVWIVGAAGAIPAPDEAGDAGTFASSLRDRERSRRAAFPTRLHRSADAYVVRRGQGRTIVAGYPWFTDWGRDTFIAMRGLCLATGRLDDARHILVEWAGTVRDGLLPNRFADAPGGAADAGGTIEFNSVDAALWYVVAVHDFFESALSAGVAVSDSDRDALVGAVSAIVAGYGRGTRYGIRIDSDGLLAAGEPGVQMTWMDAKVGDWVVTPRIGKPVEVQALWLNAIWIADRLALPAERSAPGPWSECFERGRRSFNARFWNDADGCLYDVVDVDHRPGTVDAAFRPNQIFAVGGLPIAVLDGSRARRVVDAVETKLWTPLGLRSLAPGSPRYATRYLGGVLERDGAYHQGTVWPWLMGPFVEAWVRVRGGSRQVKREARERFLQPLLRHLDEAGLGHISEIADAEAPHTPRGCPWQAWSLGETLRVAERVLAE